MATSFDATPKWFDANFYMAAKLAKMIEADPNANWTPASLQDAFNKAGYTNPYDHYLTYGDMEGLTPNVSFNNAEYLADKAAQMGSTWTPEMVATAIKDANLTLMQHYVQFGSTEGLSPSSAFNQDKYYEAKLEQLQTADPTKGWTLDTLKAAFAAAGLSPLEHYMLYAKVEGLAVHDYSDAGKPIPHPGNKITLTTGADTVTADATVAGLKTSSRDDTISAIVGSSTKGTLTAGDVIDGGDGEDTLTVDMQTSYNYKSGSIKNVENIVLNNYATGAVSFDAKGVVGADEYTVSGGKGMTIKNVDSTETDYSLTRTSGKLEVQIVDSALTGKEDNVSIALNGVNASTADKDAPVNITVGGTKEAVEGVTLLAVRGSSNYVNLTEGHETVTVMGAGNVMVDVAAGLKSFDASDATGKVVADLKNATATLKTITGGEGNDTFTVNGLATSAVVNGGDGDDTLKLGALASGANFSNAITGVETIEVTATTTSTAARINLNKIEGLETFKVTGAVVGTDVFDLRNATNYDALNLELSNMLTSVAGVKYDGAGELNVIHSGTDATGASATVLNSLTANTATELNFSNTAAKGLFEVASLTATKVETITIDAGDEGFTLSKTDGNMNALTSITVTGDDTVILKLNGSATAFDTIDASDLQGNLTVDLSKMTLGDSDDVTMTITGAASYETKITMTADNDTLVYNGGTGTDTIDGGAGNDTITVNGNGNFKITGGAGADVINLSDGKDTVVYAATGDFGGAGNGSGGGLETINGFTSGTDVIQFAGLMGSLTANAPSVSAAYDEVSVGGTVLTGKVNGFNIDFGDNKFGFDASHVADALSGYGGLATSAASGGHTILAISDGHDTYLWQYVETSTGTIGSAELTLIGVLDEITSFTASDFAYAAV